MALCSHYTLPTAVTASCVCSPVTRPQPEPHGQTSVSPEWLKSHDLTKSPNVGGSRSSFESSWSQCRRMQVSGTFQELVPSDRFDDRSPPHAHEKDQGAVLYVQAFTNNYQQAEMHRLASKDLLRKGHRNKDSLHLARLE